MASVVNVRYRAFWRPAGSWVAFPGLLGVDIVGGGGGEPNGLGWGIDITPEASIRATAASSASNWRYAPVYAELSADAGVTWKRVFTGVIIGRSDDGIGYRYRAESLKRYIETQPVRTPLRYRRPIATTTSAISVEDPASLSHRAGLVNEICWRCGGRPLEQAGLYPSAPFYYSCTGTSIAPEWGWVDGTNAWNELQTLAEASGGQVIQDGAGVIRFVSPLQLAETSGTPFHYTASVYSRATVEEVVDGLFNVARCDYVRRALAPQQQIIDDTTAHSVAASATVTLPPFATQWPVYRYGSIRVTAARYTGEPVAVTVATVEATAQQLVIQVSNPLAEPIIVVRVAVEGEPIVQAASGVATASTAPFAANNGNVELRLSENVYIQTQADAERRARMALYVYSQPRPIWRLSDCPYRENAFVGEYVLFSAPRRSIASQPSRIVDLQIDRSGERCTVGLVSVAGVPKLSDYFVVGQTYADGTVRRAGL